MSDPERRLRCLNCTYVVEDASVVETAAEELPGLAAEEEDPAALVVPLAAGAAEEDAAAADEAGAAPPEVVNEAVKLNFCGSVL